MSGRLIIHTGDALTVLSTLPSDTVHCCVTSPPYWGLRDYGVDGQMGLERKPEEYVAGMVRVFGEVRRVLRDDGTLWLNIGDSYATGAGKVGDCPGGGAQGDRFKAMWAHPQVPDGKNGSAGIPTFQPNRMPLDGLKAKDLVGIPWMLAFALRADGWYLRSDIIWHKPNPMPESVRDRPTKAHEYLFLMSKSERYYYDADAIAEYCSEARAYKTPDGWDTSQRSHGSFHADGRERGRTGYVRAEKPDKQRGHGRRHDGFNDRWDHMKRTEQCSGKRNKRDVWTVATKPYSQAHFATFPPDLVKPCVLAGCPEGGTVLDPFGGSGTTGEVALSLGRMAVLIELNPEYVKLADDRCREASLQTVIGCEVAA